MDNVIEGAATTPAAEAAPRPTVARQALLGGLAVVLFLAAILAFGGYLRMVGRNWDESQSLHPDERFLTMVTAAVRPASGIRDYFDTAKSPLNPYNNNFGSFVYGTLPLFVTRYTAETFKDATWLQGILGVKGPLTGYGEVGQLGRLLSSLFDLVALVVLFLIGRRLYDTRVGLLAAALGAFTVLNIQQSHFYTADTFANCFALLTFLFAVRVLQGGRWYDYTLLGLSFAAAIGSRINLLTLLGVVAIAIGVRLLDAWQSRRAPLDGQTRAIEASAPTSASVLLGALLFLVVTLVAFRLFMPYAFLAPDGGPLSWLRFNPQWREDMANAQRMNRGDVDVPFGHQWADRAPLWFPLYNMVWFGLGIPLGIAAWVGWGVALVQSLLGLRGGLDGVLSNPRLRAHILPVAWIAITFLFHGTQWVKSIRYFLQMYPLMALMAAWLLVFLWDWTTRRAADQGRTWTLGRGLTAVFAAFVVGGTVLYAVTFTGIYQRPVTRVEASRWIYENVPTGATVTLATASGERKAQVAIPNKFVWNTDGALNVTPFKVPADGTLGAVQLNFLADSRRDADPETLEVIVARDAGGRDVVARGQITANLERGGAKGQAASVTLDNGVGAALEAGRDYYLATRALKGAPIQSFNAALANEHWDDGIPLRVDGKDGFSIYQGLEITNYDEDEPAKLDKLVDRMDQADYIFMTSGRLYESIPRLPMRWPMTTRYYELMLNNPEALGYRRAAEFTSYPQLGPLVWNDDGSEEQFRVYDHPKVLIFEKTPAFNKAEAKQLLGEGIEWGGIQRLWDKEATNVYNNARWRKIPLIGALIADRLAPLPSVTRAQAQAPAAVGETTPKTDLMLPKADWVNQQLSGTWSSLFNPQSIVNQSPVLSVVAWFLAIQLLGIVVFPIAFAVFRFLGDRGWFSSKILGLLLASYGAWLLASVQRIMPFGPLMVWGVVLALALVSALFAWRQWPGLRGFFRARGWDVLAGELVFLALFLGFLAVRMGNPDLWHPFMGGEKPMDFAYLNGVIRTQFFPSYDPWFAGGYLNYYYYGFVMVATLVLMTGIVPSVAYNLAVPLFFALTGLGAFAVVYNLVDRAGVGRGDDGNGARRGMTGASLYGALGALFVVVVGNLGEVKLLADGLSGLSQSKLQSNIPGLATIANTLNGMRRVLSGDAQLGFRQEWWYWNASRAIPHPQTETVPITEFPYFTFLYGDLHAHMLTLPLTLLALALALNAALRWRGAWRLNLGGAGWPTALASWLIFGLTIGALRPANTWDYPTYLVVATGAFALAAYRHHGLTLRALGETLWRAALVFALSNLLWLPFISNFATAFTSVEPWTGSRTVWWSYLIVHGFFLFTVVTFLLFQVRDWYLAEVASGRGPVARRLTLQVTLILAGATVILAVFDYGAWVIGLPILTVALLLLLRRPAAVEEQAADEAGWLAAGLRPTPSAAFIGLLVAAAVGLTLVVDVIVLKGDISRMNTVFKFYLQVWVMLGVAAAAGLAWVWASLRRVSAITRVAWEAAFALLLFGVLLYPVFATWGRVNDRFDRAVGPTLDGMAYMSTATYSDAPDGRPVANYALKWDRDAIQWMEQNIPGTPVILEAHTPEYRWGSRVSIYTGFPTVVGWSNHQRQQRSALTTPVVDQRGSDVKLMFDTPDANRALDLMRRYSVGYVYVGPTEKAYYRPEGIAKFERMAQQGQLEKVYSNQEVTIYRVVGGTPG